MKTKFLPFAAAAAVCLLASCEADVNTPPAGGDSTTVVTPGKDTESNTTVVSPAPTPAPAPAPSTTERTTESNTTVSPSGTSVESTTTTEQR